MDIEQARKITGQCVKAGTWFLYGGEPCEVPDVSLAELVEANRIVRESPAVDGGNGRRIVHTVCDDRLTAALYAIKHYGSPEDLLAAVGFELSKA